MLNRRRFITASSAALAAFALPARAAGENAMTLWGPPVTPTALLAVAAQHSKMPFSVQTWRSPDQLRAGLINGDIAASIVPSYVAANLYNQGQKVKLFNIMTEGLLYLAARNSADKPAPQSLADLPGRSLVIPFKNDMPDLVLQALCRKAGVDFASIQVQYTATPPEALMLFLSGRVDCALLPEPVMAMAEIKSKEKGAEIVRALDIQTLWGSTFDTRPALPQAGLLFSDAFSEKHGDFISALDGELQNALTWSTQHPEETAELAAKHLPFPNPVLRKALAHSHLTATRAVSIEEEILHFFAELHALNPKITGGKMPDAGLFYR